MSIIDASLVKKLRDKTGAGFMNCKQALVEVAGDFEKAIEWIKVKGLAAAAKKADRVAAEGLTAVCIKNNKAVAVEINSETDFVAKNEFFQNLVTKIVDAAIDYTDIEQLKQAKLPNGQTVGEEIISNIASIGENLTIRRMESIKIDQGVIASYVHNSCAPNMGKIAVLVALESTGDQARLYEVAKSIAMHVAAAKPQALNVESLDPELIAKEKAIFQQQTENSGKPQNIIEKMIEGRIRKFLEEIVLMEQVHMIEGNSKISEVIANLSKELSTPVKLVAYTRLEVGEGIEKEAKNFAEEVAAVTR